MKINRLLFILLLYSVIIICFSLQGCIFPSLNLSLSTKFDAGYFLTTQENQIGRSSQVLLVRENSFLFFNRSKLYLLEKSGDNWKMVYEPFNAVIGRNGFAKPGEKREGDGKTPSGIYPLKITFGYDETTKTKMPYRQALDEDVWVDDPDAYDYNRWTNRQETKASSYEMMKRDDNLYQYGIVMEYNTNPVIKGSGSAIFLHIWKCEGLPTTGCVAVSEENILKVLEWLNPDASPLIITGIVN